MTHDDSMNAEDPRAGMTHDAGTEGTMSHGRPYRMFWLNMIPALIIMYLVMFSMIDGLVDFKNNLNMFYMAVTMWAPWES